LFRPAKTQKASNLEVSEDLAVIAGLLRKLAAATGLPDSVQLRE